MRSSDRVSVTTIVAADPATAFAVFTEEIDQWWRRGPRYRGEGEASVIVLEAGVGGRLLELGAGRREQEIGRVLVWQPSARLVLGWSRDGAGSTEVEVGFVAEGEGTRVTIEHRGWDRVPAEHRARHGLIGHAFSEVLGLWWGDLLTGLQVRASAHNARIIRVIASRPS